MRGIIVGGGIGGLCAAVALQRSGTDVHVYEEASMLKPIGAGIMIAPNAMWVFEQLGLAGAVKESSASLERLIVSDHRGRVLTSMDGHTIERRFGHTIAAIHRADLHRLLRQRLEGDVVHLRQRCVGCRSMGAQVVAAFDDGSEATGDFLVGADGLRSAVRQTVFPKSQLRYSGQTCWRGVLMTSLGGGSANGSEERWGFGIRVGFLPIGGGQVYWFATANRDAGGLDADDPRPELLQLFGGLAEPVPSIVAETPPQSIVRHDLYDLEPLSSWSVGRMTLLGDAAHAPTPNLGQGGAQAIEDAWVLADELAKTGDPATAFRRYERRRMPKAHRVVRESRRFGRIAGLAHPALCALRNSLVRWTPEVAMRWQLDWVLRAPSVKW